MRRPLLPPHTLVAALCSVSLLGVGCGNNDDKQKNNTTPTDMGSADMNMPTDMGGMDMNPPPDMGGVDMNEPVPDGEDLKITAFQLYPPVPVSCDNPTGRFRLPFALISDKVRPAVPGDRFIGRPLLPNETVTVGSIDVRRPRVSAFSDTVCTSDADCSDGFKCSAGGTSDALRQCTSQASMSFVPDTVKHDVEATFGETKRQLVAVLVDNSSSITGVLPKEVGQLYDESGSKALSPIPELATDSLVGTPPILAHRRVVSEGFLDKLASVMDPVNSAMSLWWFAGDLPIHAVPLTAENSEGAYFTNDLSEPFELVKGIPNPGNSRGTGNVYQAIMRVIEKDFDHPKYADHEKFIMVVTDGPNEVWIEDATYAKVLEALNKHNIHLHIVHFDPEIDVTKMRDPLAYWRGNRNCRNDNSCDPAPSCNSDGDCQSFEECRKVKLYAENAEDPVTETDARYCVPSYAGGRVGPVDEYAELACRTGGNYYYASSVEQIFRPLRALPHVVDGQWSVEVDIPQLDPAKGAKSGYYRLSGVFMGLFGNVAIGERLSSSTPNADGSLRTDNRPIVRAGR